MSSHAQIMSQLAHSHSISASQGHRLGRRELNSQSFVGTCLDSTGRTGPQEMAWGTHIRNLRGSMLLLETDGSLCAYAKPSSLIPSWCLAKQHPCPADQYYARLYSDGNLCVGCTRHEARWCIRHAPVACEKNWYTLELTAKGELRKYCKSNGAIVWSSRSSM